MEILSYILLIIGIVCLIICAYNTRCDTPCGTLLWTESDDGSLDLKLYFDKQIEEMIDPAGDNYVVIRVAPSKKEQNKRSSSREKHSL